MSEEKSPEPKGLGEKIVKFQTTLGWLQLVGAIIFFVVVEAAFWHLGTLQLVETGFGAMMVFVLVIIFFNLKYTAALKRIDTSFDTGRQALPPIPQTPLNSDETVRAAVAGINWVGWRVIKRNSTLARPENALLVTDKNFVFIYAPLPFGDQVINMGVVALQNWIWAEKDIEDKLNMLLKTRSLVDLYASYRGNFCVPFSGVDSVLVIDKVNRFCINMKDGSKFEYAIKTADNYKKFRNAILALGLPIKQ